jgi:hypothetical protein
MAVRDLCCGLVNQTPGSYEAKGLVLGWTGRKRGTDVLDWISRNCESPRLL